MCVLVQGFILTKANYMKLLQLVRNRMQLIEDDWAKIAQLQEESPETSPSYQRAQLPLILQNIVFALNSLPNEAAPIMVMITDGVLDLMNVYAYDNLLMQLTRHDIQCHFLRIGGGNDESSSFGFVPDNDLLGFLADSTGGTLLDYNISVQHTIGTTSQNKTPQDIFEGISLMQRDIFVRRSSIQGVGGGLSGPKLPIDDLASIAVGASMSTLPLLRPFRLWREKVHEYCIWVEIDRILEARVREGFQVTKVFLEPEIKQEASSSSTSDAAGLTSNTLSDRKVSLGFLLQWKENVWLEYVVSSTDTPRPLLKGASVKANVSSSKTPQGSSLKSREWHIRMNVIAHVEFLKTFEESSGTAVETTTRGSTTGGTPPYLHDFIRNVQDVDRVLLHLMTATALVSSNVTAASGGIEGYNTFASSSAGASYVAGVSRATSHPVFNIIGELSPVLWHRWFNVERFEVLCVIKDDHFMDIFYRNDVSNVQDSNRYISRQSASKQRGTRQAFNHRVDNNVIRHISAKGDAIFLVNSVDQVMDGILNILQKWSSLKLGKDLYLKFLA
jgi:hypothetical protein